MLTLVTSSRRLLPGTMVCAAALSMIGALGCGEDQGAWSRSPSESPRLPLLSAPAGERWTIECLVHTGPDRVAQIDRLAELLRRTRGIESKQVNVVHADSTSTLYYGQYVRREDPQTGKPSFPRQMDRDIQFIRQLAIDPTHRPFAAARRILQESPDEGPPEWDLGRAKGYYSLQIAVFYNTGEFHQRKKAAADYCRYWREKGYDAYFFHGPTRSSTTVGDFPEQAAEETVAGRHHYGAEVRALQNKEPEFVWNLENGHRIYERRNGQRIPQRSVLIKIPSSAPSPDHPIR